MSARVLPDRNRAGGAAFEVSGGRSFMVFEGAEGLAYFLSDDLD
jgi:hypothetical protein